MGITLLDTASALATDTTQKPSGGLNGASQGMLLLVETSAIGSSTTQWDVTPQFLTPAGTAITLGTVTVTEAGTKELPLTGIFANGTTDRPEIVPFPNQILYAISSSGTTDTVSATVVMITPD